MVVNRSQVSGRRRAMSGVAGVLMVISLVASACGSSTPAEGPAAVVSTALDKVAAKDLDGLRALACAGQEDLVRSQLGLLPSVGSDLLPGLDTQALIDAVKLDVSKVKIGDPVVTGDTATVPVSGDLGVTFDAAVMRPILKQLLATQGTTMTDAQIDALLSGLAAYGQSVPVDQSIRLVQENGAWKICQETLGSPSPS
jgi:hypothetical protein